MESLSQAAADCKPLRLRPSPPPSQDLKDLDLKAIPRLAADWGRHHRDFQGLLLEFATYLALRRLRLSPWMPSSARAWQFRRGVGADVYESSSGCWMECKNWNPHYSIGPDKVEEEIASRFDHSGGGRRLLVISSLAGFTPGARERLRSICDTVIQLGFTVEAENVGYAVWMLTRLLSEVLIGTFLSNSRYPRHRTLKLSYPPQEEFVGDEPGVWSCRGPPSTGPPSGMGGVCVEMDGVITGRRM